MLRGGVRGQVIFISAWQFFNHDGPQFAPCRHQKLSVKEEKIKFLEKGYRKVPVEKESSLSVGGAIIFLALFPQNYSLCQQHNMPDCRET